MKADAGLEVQLEVLALEPVRAAVEHDVAVRNDRLGQLVVDHAIGDQAHVAMADRDGALADHDPLLAAALEALGRDENLVALEGGRRLAAERRAELRAGVPGQRRAAAAASRRCARAAGARREGEHQGDRDEGACGGSSQTLTTNRQILSSRPEHLAHEKQRAGHDHQTARPGRAARRGHRRGQVRLDAAARAQARGDAPQQFEGLQPSLLGGAHQVHGGGERKQRGGHGADTLVAQGAEDQGDAPPREELRQQLGQGARRAVGVRPVEQQRRPARAVLAAARPAGAGEPGADGGGRDGKTQLAQALRGENGERRVVRLVTPEQAQAQPRVAGAGGDQIQPHPARVVPGDRPRGLALEPDRGLRRSGARAPSARARPRAARRRSGTGRRGA